MPAETSVKLDEFFHDLPPVKAEFRVETEAAPPLPPTVAEEGSWSADPETIVPSAAKALAAPTEAPVWELDTLAATPAPEMIAAGPSPEVPAPEPNTMTAPAAPEALLDETTDVLIEVESSEDEGAEDQVSPEVMAEVAAALAVPEMDPAPGPETALPSSVMAEDSRPEESAETLPSSAFLEDAVDAEDSIASVELEEIAAAQFPEAAVEGPAPIDAEADTHSRSLEEMDVQWKPLVSETAPPETPSDRGLLTSIYEELLTSSHAPPENSEPAPAAPPPPIPTPAVDLPRAASNLSPSPPPRPETAKAKSRPLMHYFERSDEIARPMSRSSESDLAKDVSMIKIRDRAGAGPVRDEISNSSSSSAESRRPAGGPAKGVRVLRKPEKPWRGPIGKSLGILARRGAAGLVDCGMWAVMGWGLCKLAFLVSGFGAFHGRAWEWAYLVALPLMMMTALLALSYGALFGSIAGRTPGMMLFGLRLAKENGASPGIGRAFIRTGLFLVSLIPLGLGLLPVIMAAGQNTFHDRLSGVRVERA